MALPRFPTNAIRQRGLNVTVTDPEKDFQKVALDSCRSTIVTQEAELRTLKESLDVRNKKIIQLEGQISHAARHIAERPSDQVSLAEYHNSSASAAHIEDNILSIYRL